MTQEGMARLEKDIWGMVLGASADMGRVKSGLASTLNAEPLILMMAWPELVALGSHQRWRTPFEVDWALGIVNDALRAIGPPDADWLNLTPAAHGLVDAMALQAKRYIEEHRKAEGP